MENFTEIHIEEFHENEFNKMESPFMEFELQEQEKNLKAILELSLFGNQQLVIQPPKSFLLYGPRGTGKTEIVEKLAKKLNLNVCIISIYGSLPNLVN